MTRAAGDPIIAARRVPAGAGAGNRGTGNQGATDVLMSAEASYDIVIVGAGHNGLVCAFYLARAGLRVKGVERRAVVTEEFHPGFRNSVCSYVVSLL